jgi:hypothetical protein
MEPLKMVLFRVFSLAVGGMRNNQVAALMPPVAWKKSAW